MTTIITVKMQVDKPLTVYFNPPLLNVEEIQLIEVWVQFESYLICCDIIDSRYSLINFDDDDGNTSTHQNYFPRGESNPPLRINSRELSNLTLTIKTVDDMATSIKEDVARINLKILHG